MSRWLALLLGLVIVLGAAYVLLIGRPLSEGREIDAASRAKLEKVLQDAK